MVRTRQISAYSSIQYTKALAFVKLKDIHRYFLSGTSRNNGITCTDSLSRRECHGFRGEALDSIIQSAFIVSVTSRSNGSSQSHEKIWKEGRCVFFGPAGFSCLGSHGTIVNVHQLFHRWPVRSKFCLGNRLQELMKIKEILQQFALIYHKVAITVQDQGKYVCQGSYQFVSSVLET